MAGLFPNIGKWVDYIDPDTGRGVFDVLVRAYSPGDPPDSPRFYAQLHKVPGEKRGVYDIGPDQRSATVGGAMALLDEFLGEQGEPRTWLTPQDVPDPTG